jgi:glutathione peroxidase-family protein
VMIGILNVQWFDNPGAVLLCYALQQTLAELGWESIVLNYVSGGALPPPFFKRIMRKLRSEKTNMAWIENEYFGRLLRIRCQKYEAFRSQYLRRTLPFKEVDSQLLYGYDIYIVGSDVVWKPEILLSRDADVYFLSFLSDTFKAKRISYAASIGTTDNEILSVLEEKYKVRLQMFDHISVREKESVIFLQRLCKQTVHHMPDPVFLLKKEQYDTLAVSRTCAEEYIYLYMLTPNQKAINFALALSERSGLQILYDVHSDDNLFLRRLFRGKGRAVVSDGPAEFLSRICHAKYVVTNSFHGTAFSLIFEKEVYAFSAQNAGIDTSVRLKDLLSTVGLQYRYNCVFNWENIRSINYQVVRASLYELRERGRDYLQQVLESDARR